MKKHLKLLFSVAVGIFALATLSACGILHGFFPDGTGSNGSGSETEHTHTLVEHPEKEPGCNYAGNSQYWECTECGKVFRDAQGQAETLMSSITIKSTGRHDFSAEVVKDEYLKTPANCQSKAVYNKSCRFCGIKAWNTERDVFEYGEIGEHRFGKHPLQTYNYVKTEPTCTQLGEYYETCEVCGKQGTNTFVGGRYAEHQFGEDDLCTECSVHRPSAGLSFSQGYDNVARLSGLGSCTDTVIYVPDRTPSSQLPVVGVNENAFKEKTLITEIHLPETVTAIGDTAFSDCTNLKSVFLPENLSVIPAKAFYNCQLLTDIHGGSAFLEIGELAFYNCKALATLPISEGLTAVGRSAFNGCSAVTAIALPSSLLTIGETAFSNCTSLVEITVAEGNTAYKSVDGNLYSKDGTALLQYAVNQSAAAFVIDDAVTDLGMYAFSNAKNLTGITVGNGVTVLPGGVFNNCTALTDITLGSAITKICELAFSNCIGLTSLRIPDTVTAVEDYAFSGCSNIKTFSIGRGVTDLTAKAFSSCNAVTSFAVSANNRAFSSSGGDLYTRSGSKLVRYAVGKTDASVTVNCSIIGDSAFEGCMNITQVTIGANVKEIENYAFNHCYNLEKAVFADHDGWYVSSSKYVINETKIAKKDFISLTKAALLLKSTHCSKHWYHGF